eukprot:1533587-Prymnesium_polylepis.3
MRRAASPLAVSGCLKRDSKAACPRACARVERCPMCARFGVGRPPAPRQPRHRPAPQAAPPRAGSGLPAPVGAPPRLDEQQGAQRAGGPQAYLAQGVPRGRLRAQALQHLEVSRLSRQLRLAHRRPRARTLGLLAVGAAALGVLGGFGHRERHGPYPLLVLRSLHAHQRRLLVLQKGHQCRDLRGMPALPQCALHARGHNVAHALARGMQCRGRQQGGSAGVAHRDVEGQPEQRVLLLRKLPEDDRRERLDAQLGRPETAAELLKLHVRHLRVLVRPRADAPQHVAADATSRRGRVAVQRERGEQRKVGEAGRSGRRTGCGRAAYRGLRAKRRLRNREQCLDRVRATSLLARAPQEHGLREALIGRDRQQSPLAVGFQLRRRPAKYRFAPAGQLCHLLRHVRHRSGLDAQLQRNLLAFVVNLKRQLGRQHGRQQRVLLVVGELGQKHRVGPRLALLDGVA